MPVTKDCAVCGQKFTVKANRADTAKTCSSQCRGKLQAKRYADDRPALKCERCGNAFSTKPYRAKTVKFCSRECKLAANRVDLNCAQCGKPFWDYKSQTKRNRKYCSKACHAQAQRNGKPSLRLICEMCGKAYAKAPHMKGVSRFCSKRCHNAAKLNQVEKTCEHCQSTFPVNGYRAEMARFCSEDCKWKCYTGDEAWESPDGKNREGYKRSASNGLVHRDVMLEWMLEEAPDHHFLIEVGGVKKLDSGIDVHHIDRDRTNNERSNLLAMPREVHSRVHHSRRKPNPWECWPPNPTKF